MNIGFIGLGIMGTPMARHLQGIIEGRLVSMSRANSGVFARQLGEEELVYLTQG